MPDSISLSQGEPVLLASLQTEPIQIHIENDAIDLVPVAGTPVTITLGAIPGPAGNNGEDGLDGLSAYEIAVENGFEGTEEEWLASLVQDHTHAIADITDLQGELDGKADEEHDHDDRYYTETEITAIVDALSLLIANRALIAHNHDGTYSLVGHNHDGSYYTEAEVDALIEAIVVPDVSLFQPLPVTFNFAADAQARMRADVAMTLTEQGTSGTGAVAYEKSTAAAPTIFTATASPISLQAGAWLKVIATGVAGDCYAVHLKRTT